MKHNPEQPDVTGPALGRELDKMTSKYFFQSELFCDFTNLSL